MNDLLSGLRGYNLFVREWGNGILWPSMFWLAVVTTWFLVRSYVMQPQGWREQRGVAFACVFVWFFIGETLRAGSAWIALDAQREGRRLSAILEDLASLTFMLGAVVLAGMAVRTIWLLAERRARVPTLAAAIIFTAITLTLAKWLT